MSTAGAGMAVEIGEAPEAVRRQAGLLDALPDLVRRLRHRPPHVVLTCGRGSSAHAGTFGKHLIERHLGIPVAAAAPNIATIYRQRLNLKDQLVITISQSGRSDDLAEFNAMAKSAGALTVAIVNDVKSPLAGLCDVVLPMAAGPEASIAATKSFIASLAMLLRMTAEWTGSTELHEAIERLPDRLTEAARLNWSVALDALAGAGNMTTIGRGPTLAISREAALKLKETCHLQAEPFSSAEFQHGPMALVTPRYPIVMFMPNDAAAPGMREFAADLQKKGAMLFCTGNGDSIGVALPSLAPDHPDADALCLIQTFYSLMLPLAALRGTDVERPRHLRKVTRTR